MTVLDLLPFALFCMGCGFVPAYVLGWNRAWRAADAFYACETEKLVFTVKDKPY